MSGPFTLLVQSPLNAMGKVDALHYHTWPLWPPIIQLCIYFRLPIIWSASRVSLYKEREPPLPHQSKNRFDLCYPLQIGKLTVKLCWYFRETERPNCQIMRGKKYRPTYHLRPKKEISPPLMVERGGGAKGGGAQRWPPPPLKKNLSPSNYPHWAKGNGQITYELGHENVIWVWFFLGECDGPLLCWGWGGVHVFIIATMASLMTWHELGWIMNPYD